MTPSQLNQSTVIKTLGEVVASDQASPQYTAEVSSNPPRITIRKSKPTKLFVQPTVSTSFELIEVSTHIKNCAVGCKGNIRDGSDFTVGEIDRKYCIQHKEHDFMWIESQGKYVKTFKNKHALPCVCYRSNLTLGNSFQSR